jgi:D-citramalate synthase
MNHLTHQLKKQNNILQIAQTIALASANNIASNVYLEDWNGMRRLPDYVFQFLDFLSTQPVKEYYCLTLGVLILKPLHLFQKSHRNIRYSF